MRQATILVGDVRSRLAELPDNSVQCVVTSPPYFGLRDYGTASWDGGDPACQHIETNRPRRNSTSAAETGWVDDRDQPAKQFALTYRNTCGKCGAVRIDRQIGLEPTPAEFVATMVAVLREVRRVLRPDGTCWVNLGDSYAMGTKGAGGNGKQHTNAGSVFLDRSSQIPAGLKPKDLIGIPWRVAFALQEDGWWLRSEITWCKTAPMPESVTDRPTSATEKIFLFTKNARYFYDADAVRVAVAESSLARLNQPTLPNQVGSTRANGGAKTNGNMKAVGTTSGRNLWNYWLVSPEPFSGAHFATFPTKLIEPCILAGTSERGCCASCGAPWRRVVERVEGDHEAHERPKRTAGMSSSTSTLSLSGNGSKEWAERGGKTTTTGWEPSCACGDERTVPCVVLDPFSGSGTTGVVALRHNREYIGVELNPDYAEMSRQRITRDAPLFNQVEIVREIVQESAAD